MKLHEAVDPNGEGLSLLHYQFSTLQFILGQLEDAQKLAQRSYELTVQHSRVDSDQASQHMLLYCTTRDVVTKVGRHSVYISHALRFFNMASRLFRTPTLMHSCTTGNAEEA